VEAIEAISASSSRLVRTLDTFLDIARLGSASLHVEQAPFDLVETIEEELTAVRMRYPEAIVSTSCPPEPIEVCSDELRVRQVLVNLLDNAAKYGGEPAIIDVVAERNDHGASIRVSDNGPGVAPEDQAHLFERFYRGSRQPKKGLGVGLFLSRQIVQQLGGTLTFRNLPGGGAEFTLLLPIVKKRT
ncbi:MAG TPA: HAMP domain-containing sensor histidine kinase, partial [Dehalococcoidia bacterium]|nr:HAMP domain-containing sensor histidine kinase [Dehalococcoidia bacterium]